MRNLIKLVAIFVIAFLAVGQNQVFARALIPNDPVHYRGAPGPIAGIGIPTLIAVGGAYFVVRRSRRKTK
jgi:hypothetical protein